MTKRLRLSWEVDACTPLVSGMTPLKFPEFFAAHFIGTTKTAFIDAYLGSLLLQAAFESDAMKVRLDVPFRCSLWRGHVLIIGG